MKKFCLIIFSISIHIFLSSQSIESVEPDQVEQNETLEVTVSGSNTSWTQGTNVLSFKQGSDVVYPLVQTVNSDTEIVGTVSFEYYNPAGYYDVWVEDLSDNTEVVLENGFFVIEEDEPLILYAEPNTAMQNETLDVTVTGLNTMWTQGSQVMSFKQGSTTVYTNPLTINSDTEIVGSVTFYPFHPLGNYDVSVEEVVSGTELLLEDGFLLEPALDMWIVSAEPDESTQGETLDVTVTGENTNWTQGSSILTFKQGSDVIYANPQTVNSDTEIIGTFSFTFDHSPGFYDVSVYNTADGFALNLSDGFYLNQGQQGELVAIVPDEGEQAESLSVTIFGHNTHFLQGSPSLYLQTSSTLIYPETQSAQNDSMLLASFLFNPDQPTGLYDVNVYSDGESLILADGFELLEATDLPILISLAPDSAMTGETITMEIYGENTHFDHPQIENTVKLKLGTHTINSVSTQAVDSVTLEAEFNFPFGLWSGIYHLYVKNELDGTMVLDSSFTLIDSPDGPYISEVDPDTVVQLDILWISITGVNTEFTNGSTTIELTNGEFYIYPSEQIVQSDTFIQGYFDLYTPSPGDYDIHVFDAAGGWSVIAESGIYLIPILSNREIPLESIVKTYPNPASDKIHIERNKANQNLMTVELLSLTGKRIKTLDLLPYNSLTTIDVSDVEAGVYLIRVVENDRSKTEKIVIR